jgi:transcriptional regulator with XRE-family HTH domain
MARSARGMHKSVHSPEHLAFRQLLVEARAKAKLTQQQLAKRLKRPQSFVAKYEGGERRLDVVEFIGICRAIGVDPMRVLQALLKSGSHL